MQLRILDVLRLYLVLLSLTSTLNARDVRKTLSHKTEMRPRRSIIHVFKLLRPRPDRDVRPARPRRNGDVPKKVSRPPRDRDVQDRDCIPATCEVSRTRTSLGDRSYSVAGTAYLSIYLSLRDSELMHSWSSIGCRRRMHLFARRYSDCC